MTHADGTSGGMVTAGGAQKRGPPSPDTHNAKQPRTVEITGEFKELNDLFGWLEQTVMQEKGKNLGVLISEKMMVKLARLRVVATGLTHDNSRLTRRAEG